MMPALVLSGQRAWRPGRGCGWPYRCGGWPYSRTGVVGGCTGVVGGHTGVVGGRVGAAGGRTPALRAAGGPGARSSKRSRCCALVPRA